MPNLDEIVVYGDVADEAAEWAAAREFALRWPRYEQAKLGLAGVFAKAADAARRFGEALRGLDG